MKPRSLLGHLLVALLAWLLTVIIPGAVVMSIVVQCLVASGHYDPVTSPNHNGALTVLFLGVMILGFVGVFRLTGDEHCDPKAKTKD